MVKDVFHELEGDEIIYINELTNRYIFDLYMKARKKKKDIGWKDSVWLRSSRIFAKSDSLNTIFNILTPDNLKHIA